MKQLSSQLSKPRRRIYRLLMVGLVVAALAAAVGGLIVGLGYSSPDVTVPFWECGEYVLLLSLVNLGIYAAIFWQVGRLTRREGGVGASRRGATDPLEEPGAPSAPDPSPPVPRPPPAHPPKISRQVRGTVSSLKLDT